MNRNKINEIALQIDREFLSLVRRPSRYIGGEINQVKKDLGKCSLTVALCFPDVYEVGMSNMGLAIIYDILNRIDNIAAERVFAPWVDAEEILRQKSIPLFSLESKAPLKEFDIVGFNLSNELCYTNVLNMLDLANIKVRSSQRGQDDPIIIAGGTQAACCEPMAEFIDLFLLGDGEQAVVDLIELIDNAKQAGSSKEEILRKAACKFDWAYVPSLYEFDPQQNKIAPLEPGVPTTIMTAVVEDFENAPVPLKPIVPFAQAVHERVSIEIMRGCPGRCRFCQASFCRRPIRYRSPKKILEIAQKSHAATGFDTVSLLSLSTADYPNLEELVALLHEYFRDKYVGLSLPSLRVDQQLKLLPKLFTSVRKGGLTIAVEAAGENVRQIINKPLKDTDLFAAVEAAYQAGWQRLKLYFMVGLPGETQDDIKRIVELSIRLAKLRKNVDGKTGQITAAVSWFVPKPHTPFQWLGQKPQSYFENAKKLILDEKRNLRAGFIQFKFHHIESSILESALGRGDRRLGNVIEAAWKDGAKFDLWSECFNFDIWQRAFSKFGMDIDTVAQQAFDTQNAAPWDHLGGPDRKYLLDHFEKALASAGVTCF